MVSQYLLEHKQIKQGLRELRGEPFYSGPFIHDLGVSKIAWQSYVKQEIPKDRNKRNALKAYLLRTGIPVKSDEELLARANTICIENKDIYPYEFDRDTNQWSIADIEQSETHVNQGIVRWYRALEGRIYYAIDQGKMLMSGKMPTILLDPLQQIKFEIGA